MTLHSAIASARRACEGMHPVVHLPASVIAKEAERGLDLYALARQCGVELRTVEQDWIDVDVVKAVGRVGK